MELLHSTALHCGSVVPDVLFRRIKFRHMKTTTTAAAAADNQTTKRENQKTIEPTKTLLANDEQRTTRAAWLPDFVAFYAVVREVSFVAYVFCVWFIVLVLSIVFFFLSCMGPAALSRAFKICSRAAAALGNCP